MSLKINGTPLCVLYIYCHANLELQSSPIPFMENNYQIQLPIDKPASHITPNFCGGKV